MSPLDVLKIRFQVSVLVVIAQNFNPTDSPQTQGELAKGVSKDYAGIISGAARIIQYVAS